MFPRQESTPGTTISQATQAMTTPKETLQAGLGNSLLTNMAVSIITATVAVLRRCDVDSLTKDPNTRLPIQIKYGDTPFFEE